MYKGGTKYFRSLNLPRKRDVVSVLPLGTTSLRYSELVYQVTLRCVLSCQFFKCLQICLAFFLIEMAGLKEQHVCMYVCEILFPLGKNCS
jgi:hypothetical protein